MPGSIHRSVRESWLSPGSDQERALRAFLDAGFSVSWAREIRSHNTDIRFCFLEPDEDLRRTFGFEYQVLVAFHLFDRLEPRAFQAINRFMNGDPARGRVEPLLYFLVSPAADVQKWTTGYLLQNRDERIAIPIHLDSLRKSGASGSTVKNAIRRHYLALDVFKNTLPLQDDTYFFGRHTELTRLMDATKRSENVGLFGLRKTGKTSLLLKFQRYLAREEQYLSVFLNAELSTVRKRRWHQLLEYIALDLARQISLPRPEPFTEIDAPDQFAALLRTIADEHAKSVVVILDEVEWIAPELTSDAHWNEDYLAFWQSLRGVQSAQRTLSLVVAGVNPYPVERDLVGGKPNPLFGIVTPTFLCGFSRDETFEMVSKLGKIAGLQFSDDALRYLFIQYGGHPLLTRLACSCTFEEAKARGADFPVQVNEGGLRKQATNRDRELRFYSRHVVSELEKFYPAEYALLELLAVGDVTGFTRGAKREDGARHLLQYGVVRRADTPYIEIDVVRDFIAEEYAKRMGQDAPREIVPQEDRSAFLQLRMSHICEDMRTLEGLMRQQEMPALFGPNSFPMADRLFRVSPPTDSASLAASLTPLYLAFVESIDNFGTSKGIKNYFWRVVKEYCPALHTALHRVRVYRHNEQHLTLNPGVDAALAAFLAKDLPGDLIHSEDKYWIVLQTCLDELLTALQREIAMLRG